MKTSENEIKTEKRRLLKVDELQIYGMAYCLGEVPIIKLTFEGEAQIIMLPPDYEIPKASDLELEGNEESKFKENLESIELIDQLIPNYREFIGKKLEVSFPSQGDPYVLELTAAR